MVKPPKKEKAPPEPPPPKPPVTFDEIALTSNNITTMVLALHSTEPALILRILHHFNKFVYEFSDNCIALAENDAARAVCRHLGSEHRFIRRFALRVLSQLLELPQTCLELDGNTEALQMLAASYTDVEDDEMITAYAANNLALLGKCGASNQVWLGENTALLERVMLRITTTTDPDVLYRSLQLLAASLCHPIGLHAMCSLPFPFEFVLATADQSEYPSTQIAALQLLHALAECHCNSYLADFNTPAFTATIFSLLENYVAYELHDDALELLLKALLHVPELLRRFLSECLAQFMAYFVTTKHHRLKAFDVLCRLSAHAAARTALHAVRFGNVLLDWLRTSTATNIINGISNMAHYEPAMMDFEVNDTVRRLVNRQRAVESPAEQCELANCLATLLSLSLRSCQQYLDAFGIDVLIRVLEASECPEVKNSLLRILFTLAKRNSMKMHVMTDDLAKTLYSEFRHADKHEKYIREVIACMSEYMSEPALRDELMRMDTHVNILSCLTTADVDKIQLLRNAIVCWLLSGAKYQEINNMFIDEKILDFLIKNEHCHSHFRPVIEAILSNNLPMKFAMRGHLDLYDRTADDFYATAKIWRHYACLRQIIVNDCEARRPIMLCNFNGVDETLLKTLGILREALDIDHVPYGDEVVLGPEDIQRSVAHIADLVCTTLCGRTANAADSHLVDLRRKQFPDNRIPMGALRVGGLFEKSLLFKLLADRVGLPCELHMDPTNNRLVYNTVQLPLEDGEPDECGVVPERPVPADAGGTHVIDLLDTPGELYVLGSDKAVEYMNVNLNAKNVMFADECKMRCK